MKSDFDVIVLGGGAGGLFAVSVANTLKAKTCMVEKKRLGGDCTWFGCIPSKAILKSASAANLFKRYGKFGINIQGDAILNTDKVMAHVKDIVQEISTHHPAEVFEKRGIKVLFGSPEFIDEKTIEVNNKKITSKRFIICTGSHPAVPPIEGLKEIPHLTNENIFDLEKLPQKLIVLGAGPIGVELSQALNRLGVKIYLVEMMERILFKEDSDVAKVLQDKLEEEGIKILCGKKATKFMRKNNEIYAVLEDKNSKKEEISADNVLVAVGRAPNIEGLSLKNCGVEYSKQGIRVDSYLRTTNRNIFACGDVVGPYMFSHVASYQAGICVRNALFKRIAWQKANYQNIAWATFTEPEVSHLGLTEEEAKAKYDGIKVYKTAYANADRAITDLEKVGVIKVITNKKGYILGAHIAGAQASEIIQGFLLAKSFKLTLSKLSRALFIYPTLSELIKKTAAKPLVESMDNPFVKFIMKIMKRL